MSTSKARTESQQNSQTSVQNLNLQDTQGVTLANSAGNTITLTDQGALDAGARLGIEAINSALDVGVEALRLGGDGFSEGAALAGRGLDNAQEATLRALDTNAGLARDALSEISAFGGRAIGEVADAQSGVLDFARDIFGDALGAQERLADTNLQGLGQLARQTSESADDRVTRVALYAFGAVAAVFILPQVFK